MQSCQCPVILPSDLINETKSKYGGDPAHNGAHTPSTLSKSEKSFFQLQRLPDFDPPSLMNDGELDGRRNTSCLCYNCPLLPAHSYFGSRRMNDQFPGGGNQPHSLLPTRRLGLGAAISRVEIAAIAEHMQQKCGRNSTETQLEIQFKISPLL